MVTLEFLLNGKPVRATCPSDTTVLDYLRGRGLTGTKEACGAGDCGACTVALSDADGRFRAVNSCLLPIARVSGRHLVTVEGLARAGSLHPIQQALLDRHAVQCGYCTPGVVMSLFCLFADNPQPTDDDIAAALEGNLCRCTGYEAIRAAAESLRSSRLCLPDWLESPLPAMPSSTEYALPASLSEALGLLARSPDARVVAGGTDVMCEVDRPARFVDLSRVVELQHVTATDDAVSIGAAVTLADIKSHPAVLKRLPVLAEAVGQMASAQIRNVATLAGNVANASPVADGAVLLLALGATVTTAALDGTRELPLDEFFTGHRKTALRAGEILVRLLVPAGPVRTSFIKTGKRSAVDIASVNSALALKCDGTHISTGRLALGGVAPTPILAAKAGALLSGVTASWSLAVAVADAAAAEVTPIADVRGSAEFRRTLVRNQVLAHFLRLFPELAEAH